MNLAEYASGSSCEAAYSQMLNYEMRGRVRYDQGSVESHLKLGSVDDELVEACCLKLQTDCEENIGALKGIAARDSRNDSDDEDVKDMYSHLTRILDFIVDFASSLPQAPQRRFVKEPTSHVEDQTTSYLTGFPDVTPSYVLKNIRSDTDKSSTRNVWSDKDGFCEIEKRCSAGPPRDVDLDSHENIDNTLSRGANYARLHMSARPFLLFSIGLLIFGTRFCVCIFDRAGVRISPEYDMWLNLDKFVRVVRSLTCVLDDQGIGQDPTVRRSPSNPDAYIVKPIGTDKRSWCTIGAPIWSSLSMFGRGTFVWRVAEYDKEKDNAVGPTMIMKTAWRDARRTSESSVSRHITSIAENSSEVISVPLFVTGGDVYAEGGSPSDMHLEVNSSEPTKQTGTLITVPSLGIEDTTEGGTLILHRVITGTAGRPLWEFKDERELARGFLAVIRTHKYLVEKDILHRDINPGNILLAEEPEKALAGREGFLLDFEMARVGNSPDMLTFERVGQSARGGLPAPITGTVQFMAYDLLRILADQYQLNRDMQTTFRHEEYHDLESIVLVFSYALLKNLLSIASSDPIYEAEKETLKEEFIFAFGKSEIVTICRDRRNAVALQWIENELLQDFFKDYLSHACMDIMIFFGREMRRLYDAKKSKLHVTRMSDPRGRETFTEENLTHDYLVDLFLQITDSEL